MNYFKLIFLAIFITIFTACSEKNEKAEYNKPALYWYNKMLSQIAKFDLDGADDTYTSLESEHRNSPLVPTALLIIAQAHMDEEEYDLSNFYLDEYIKRFSLSKNIDYARFLKIKANFLGFSYSYRDQELILKTIIDIKKFKGKYPNSTYMPLVETINTRLSMSKALLDKEISELYTRIDKPKAAKFYKEKLEKSWINPDEIEKPHVPFYRAIFE